MVREREDAKEGEWEGRGEFLGSIYVIIIYAIICFVLMLLYLCYH